MSLCTLNNTSLSFWGRLLPLAIVAPHNANKHSSFLSFNLSESTFWHFPEMFISPLLPTLGWQWHTRSCLVTSPWQRLDNEIWHVQFILQMDCGNLRKIGIKQKTFSGNFAPFLFCDILSLGLFVEGNHFHTYFSKYTCQHTDLRTIILGIEYHCKYIEMVTMEVFSGRNRKNSDLKTCPE